MYIYRNCGKPTAWLLILGLDSILFAIGVDNGDLNTVHQASSVINISNVAVSPSRQEDEPRPVIAGESPPQG